MLDQNKPQNIPRTQARKERPVQVIKLKRGSCTTDLGFSGLLLSFLWQLFTLNTITDFYFFSKTLTSQYYINYSSSFLLMYFYKIRGFYE